MSSDEQPADSSSDDLHARASHSDPTRPRFCYPVDVMMELKLSPLANPPKFLHEPPFPKEAAPRRARSNVPFQQVPVREGRDGSRQSTRQGRHTPQQDYNGGNWQHYSHGSREHGGRSHRDWKDSNIDEDGAEPAWDDPNEPMVLNEGFANEIASFENWKREQARKHGKHIETEPEAEPQSVYQADFNESLVSQSNEQAPVASAPVKPKEYKLNIWGSSEPASGEQSASRFSQLFGKEQTGNQTVPGVSPNQAQAPLSSLGAIGNGMSSPLSQPPGLFPHYGATGPKFQAPPGFSVPLGMQRPAGQYAGAPGQFPPGYGAVPPGFGGPPSAAVAAAAASAAGMPSAMPPGLGAPQNSQAVQNNPVSDDDFFMSMLSKPQARS